MIKLSRNLLLNTKSIVYRAALVNAISQFSTLERNRGYLKTIKKPNELNKSVKEFPQSVVKEEDLVDYITNEKRTLDELLNIDIHDFPAEHRLTCLEATIQMARLQRNPTVLGQSNTPASGSSRINKFPSKFSIDQFTTLSAVSLGIDPQSTAAIVFLPPYKNRGGLNGKLSSCLADERFQLLLLSNVTGAKYLPRPRLLVLAACLRQMPLSSYSKALASVIRLITLEINQASPYELVYIASILSGLPRRPSPEDPGDGDKVTVLGVEADLLRDALRSHLMSRLSELETLSLMAVLRLGYDFSTDLALSSNASSTTMTNKDIILFLGLIETVVLARVKEQNLYTACLIFEIMLRLNTIRPGLISRNLGQLRRKLHLARIYPLTNQSPWISAFLAALSSVSVSHRVSSSLFNISGFCQLRTETHFLNETNATTVYEDKIDCDDEFNNNQNLNAHSALDVHPLFKQDWVRQLLFDAADYVVEQTEANGNITDQEKKNNDDVALTAVRTCLALLSLGVRYQKLVDVCNRLQFVTKDFLPFADLHVTEVSDRFNSKNSPPITTDKRFEWTKLVNLLPRADWQLYYRLAAMQPSEFMHLNLSDSQKRLFRSYVALKQKAVESFIASLSTRLSPSLGLEIFPFHVVELENGNQFYADIIIRKQSTVDPNISKYALCFLTWHRDVMVSAPLEALSSSYSRNTSIPFLSFVHCDWSTISERNVLRDESLKRVGKTFGEAAGVSTLKTKVHPIREFIN